MNDALRTVLVAMDDYDQSVRAELAADGSLFQGYHPRMAAVHDANAARLREIIREHGWPTTTLVGIDGANAAFRIAQHSINHPDFMRECRDLIEAASVRGEIPRNQFAYIDDRIRGYEGRPQLYGTQWRDGVNGVEPFPVDDWNAVNRRRRDLGLPSLEEMQAQSSGRSSPDEVERMRVEELAWRRKVGWTRQNQASVNDFDIAAMYAAMDALRTERGLSWTQVARQLWEQSAALNEQRRDHPISPSTLTGIAKRGDCTCQHALFILRWLGRPPESFLSVVPRALEHASLPAAGPDQRLRWDLGAVYEALDARRRERGLTWRELAAELQCSDNQLTGIRTARYAIGMKRMMRIVVWLGCPASTFITAARW